MVAAVQHDDTETVTVLGFSHATVSKVYKQKLMLVPAVMLLRRIMV